MSHFAVIGAGITGVTTAYALLERGHTVTLIDRHRYAAMETSFANGGQLSACNAEVWNNLGTVLKGLKWLTRRDAPLLMNPRPGWHKYSWLTEFVAAIPGYRTNTRTTVQLAMAARKHLFAMAAHEGIAFDHEQRGILHIFRDAKSFAAAERVNALLNEAGLERHAVSPAEIAAIEPTLSGPFHGGFYTPSDSTGDIHKFTRGLADACQRRGAVLLFDRDVRRIAINASGTGSRIAITHADISEPASGAAQVDRLDCDGVVICAGIASRRFAAMVGDRVNIYPVKGYSITVGLDAPADQAAAPWVSLLDEAAKIVTSRLGANRFRVAGTAEFNDANRDIRADRIKPLVDWTRRLFPTLNTDDVTPWAGLRPMMPDMMPRVGPGSRPGVFYNTGHGHLGWTLSGVTAQLVAAAIDQAGEAAAGGAVPVRRRGPAIASLGAGLGASLGTSLA